MQFNESNIFSSSPSNITRNNNGFKTPQNKTQAYITNPNVNKIKESYYLKTGRGKKINMNDSWNEIKTPSNSNKFAYSIKESSNDKYEIKIRSIIERRMNLQQKNLKKCLNESKPITPEKQKTETTEKKKKYIKNSFKFVNHEEFIKQNFNTEKVDIGKTEALKNISINNEISNSLIIQQNENDKEKLKTYFNEIIKDNNLQKSFNSEIIDDLSTSFQYNYKIINNLVTEKKNYDERFIKEVYIDGSIFYGIKTNNLKNGKGILINANKKNYAGEFKNGKKDGFGILKDFDGQIIYEGNWKCNKYHGKGKLINIEKKMSNKLFNYKNMDSIQDNWSKYEGEFFNGLYHGIGVLVLNSSKSFQGEFKQGYIHGHGVIFDNLSQQKYSEGEWRLNIYVSNIL